MTASSRVDDPRWPRAGTWLSAGPTAGSADLAVVGVPAHRTSLSPTRADTTPAAIRAALARFSTYSAAHAVDIEDISVRDYGDVPDPDGPAGEERVQRLIAEARQSARMVLALGGDNSITFPVALAMAQGNLAEHGLITVDAHHDLRDGVSNGSPVQRLFDAGLDGARVVQIGIADFANSADYAARARDHGITVITRGSMRARPIVDIVAEAVEIAGRSGGAIHVDLDVDVCDRAVAPACPASVPGGISADDLRQIAFHAASSVQVHSIDITEIDAQADTADERTVRLGALLVLEIATGLACR
jgi:formiminoglutamase